MCFRAGLAGATVSGELDKQEVLEFRQLLGDRFNLGIGLYIINYKLISDTELVIFQKIKNQVKLEILLVDIFESIREL